MVGTCVDTLIWRPADLSNVDAMIALSMQNFAQDVDNIFLIDPMAGARNLSTAIVNQFYQPLTELVSVAVDSQHTVQAWTWARSTDIPPWSDQRMVMARMAAVNMNLSVRTRVQLIKNMLALWEALAGFAGLNIVCSSSMRSDHAAFMRIHAAAGYTVRGSNAYKRLK